MAKYEFQTEVNQLLKLIIHSMYSNKDIFLREIVSNASDALDKLKYLTVSDDAYKSIVFNPRIDITFDEKKQVLTVQDNGIGMSEQDLTANLGTIARSGTKAFIEQLSKSGNPNSDLIGQFGVGFYSAFMAAKLIDELLRPEGETARSPFPAGTSLQQLEVAQGRARLDLSGQYARLSGIDLSLADACVTLTLTQLSGIYAVSITANGRELPYRQTQLLTAADALLSSNEDVLRPIDVTLWFLDVRTGQLRELQQTIGLFEGQSRVSAVLDALKAGPDGDETLQKLLPEDFAILSARTEDGICSVNLSSQSAQLVDETLRGIAMESLSRSILSLSGVEEVRYLVDGESAPQWTLRADAQSAE